MTGATLAGQRWYAAQRASQISCVAASWAQSQGPAQTAGGPTQQEASCLEGAAGPLCQLAMGNLERAAAEVLCWATCHQKVASLPPEQVRRLATNLPLQQASQAGQEQQP